MRPISRRRCWTGLTCFFLAVAPILYGREDFSGFSPWTSPTNLGSPVNSDREELETTLIRSLIASYFNIVRLSIQDLVPKAIMHLLVNFSRESVQNRLVASLYKENLFEELLYEDEGLTSERKRVKQLLDAYREAFNTLSEVTFKPSGGST